MNKKIGIGLMLLVILSLGCYGLNETRGASGRNLSINNEIQNEIRREGNNNGESQEYQMPTLENYLGLDYNKLIKVQIKELSKFYNKISDFKIAEDSSNYEEYQLLWEEFNNKLASYGVEVPFSNYGKYIDSIKDKISEKDYKKLLDLDEKINNITFELEEFMENDLVKKINDKEKELNKLSKELGGILKNNKIDPDEVSTQIESSSIHLALFDVKEGEITLSDKSLKGENEISKEGMQLYKELWNHSKKIIPAEYINKLSKFEINTDGIENVMAHVVPENTEASKWRLALDIKDCVNGDGSYMEEFNNTVIHEFAHVITLNKEQMLPLRSDYSGTYTVDEGSLTKESYLNKFYNKFWADIIDEHSDINNADYTEEESEEKTYEFYEKYEDKFVSDYAATNPAEDIAETYRCFVTEDKPTGNTIKEQKILFLYEFKELVKYREDIRKNLGL